MKASEIQVGREYAAKVSGKVVGVRVLEIRKVQKTPYRRGGLRYDCLNLKTLREVTFKSAAKFRYRISK